MLFFYFFCFRLPLLESAFLIFVEVDAFRKVASICRKCYIGLEIRKEWIPLTPWIPPVSEDCSRYIVRVISQKCSVVIIVIEIFLECMDFTIYIRAGNDTSFEHK